MEDIKIFNFIDAGGEYVLIQLTHNPGYCLNIPGGQQNVRVTLYTCNTNDSDQRFKPVYISGNPNYVFPLANGTTGILETAQGVRLSISSSTNGGFLEERQPNNNDSNQKITFNTSRYGYTFTRTGSTAGVSTTGVDYFSLNRGPMNTHTYNNPGGRYGTFGFVDLGSGWYQIKSYFNPNYCLWTTNGNSNTNIKLYPCDTNNIAMRYRVSENGNQNINVQ